MLWVSLLLMVAYGALHTIMAGWLKPRFQAWWGQRAYEGLYRMAFNVFALIGLIPIGLVMGMAEPRLVWQIPTAFAPVLVIVQFIGILGAGLSLLQIDGMRFLGVRQLRAYLNNEALPLPDEPLKTDGVYGLVRHPLYLFSILLIWPVSVMNEAYLGVCLGMTLYFIVGSIYEERRLVTAFGEAYAAYQQRVPRLIPFMKWG